MYLEADEVAVWASKVGSVPAGWGDLETDEQEVYCVQAMNAMNLLPYRYVAAGIDAFPLEGYLTVPDTVKYAFALWVLELYKNVINPDKEFESMTVQSQTMDFAKTAFNEAQMLHRVYGIPTVTIWRYLSPYLADPRGERNA